MTSSFTAEQILFINERMKMASIKDPQLAHATDLIRPQPDALLGE